MPQINPLTKDQLFEKKIAENTGSNYNVGDISDVVPVTKDQSLLKEIALNSAGQSEDITELEGKVTANAEAIEAITDEVNNIETLQTIYPSMLLTGSITIKRNCGVKFVVADNLTLTAALASGDFIELCTAGTVLNPPVVTTEFMLHAASGGVNIAPVNLIMAADGSIYVKNYSSSDTLLYAHCCGAYI